MGIGVVAQTDLPRAARGSPTDRDALSVTVEGSVPLPEAQGLAELRRSHIGHVHGCALIEFSRPRE